MKRGVLWITLILLFIPTWSFSLVYIDIEAPGQERLPIAIARFVGDPALDSKVREVLKKDLNYTGFFEILKEETFLEEKPSLNIDFKQWQLIGAHLLVKGQIETKGEFVKLNFFLYDVNNGLRLLGKSYVGRKKALRYIVHNFADDMIERLTGEPSVFNTKIAFVYKTKRGKEIYVTDFDGYNPRPLTQFHNICLSPSWSPTGDKLLFTSYKKGNPDVYLLDLKKQKVIRLIHYAGLNIAPSWSPDGRSIAVTLSLKGKQGIYLVDVHGQIKRRLISSSGINVSPTWSPDGSKLAFVSDRAGSPQIYILDLKTNRLSRLTFEGKYNVSPVWSPKGDYIAYAGIKDGHFQIFMIRSDGSEIKQLTDGYTDCQDPSWSPDGRFIVFSQNRKICVLRLIDGKILPLLDLPGAQSQPSWSPRLK